MVQDTLAQFHNAIHTLKLCLNKYGCAIFQHHIAYVPKLERTDPKQTFSLGFLWFDKKSSLLSPLTL